MSTYSLTLRADIGRKLTIAEMDGNFLYASDISNNALTIANEALVTATTAGTSSVLLDPNQNLLAGLEGAFTCGSSQSYILSSNGLISGSKGSSILGGNSAICNTGDCFYGAPFAGFILGGTNNFITGGDSCSYTDGSNTYIYNNPNVSIYTSGGSVIGGCANSNYASDNASIIGGRCNSNDESSNSSIIGAQFGCVCLSNSSSLIGGCRMKLYNSCHSGLFSGQCNKLDCTDSSTIIGGRRNCIIGGTNSYGFDNSQCSSIIGGSCNKICITDSSSIIGGYDNCITYCSDFSSIIGGYNNRICYRSSYSGMLGGYSNDISSCSSYSAIIGGRFNCLSYSCNSIILGGTGLTLSNACNTVLVDNLIVKGDLTDEFGNSIVSGGIIQGTYSEILTLKNNSELLTGQKYKISDIADKGLIMEATSNNQFSIDAVAGFLNADYQNLGNYEGTPATQSAGLWNIDFESPVVNYTTYPLIRWQTDEDVSSLSLNTFTRTNNSVGRITLIEPDGGVGYYIYYVVLSIENVDYRNDTQITQDEVTYYVINSYSDLNQSGISTGQLITTDTGLTASITDSYQNDLYYVELDSKIDLGTSSYFYSDTYVYASIDSYNLPNTIGKVVIWNQLHWGVIDYTLFNGTSPDGNTFSYTVLNKTTTNGYIEEWDKVKYDIDTNSFGLRSDKRGNKLTNNNFPWGSDQVLNVVSESSTNNICVVLSSYGGEYGNSLYGFSDSIIVGGACNTISNSDCAAILGGRCNTICGNNYGYGPGGCNPDYSAIVGGSDNKIVASDYTPIIGGYCNTVCESDAGGIFAGCYNRLEEFSCNSTIIGGCDNCVTYRSEESSIIGGANNRLSCYSCCSSIIGGRNNFICNGGSSVIMGGTTNRVCDTCNSVVSGGDWACVRDTCSSGVFAGAGNRIVGASMSWTYRNAIVGGHCGHICNGSCDSAIMGGCCNRITNCSNNSVILGGSCLTLDDEPNKVLVSKLKINQVDVNLDNSRLLTIDDFGNVNFRTFDSFTSSGGIVIGVTESMTGFMNQIYNSSNGSVIGGGYNCVCGNSNNSSIIGGFNNNLNCYSSSSTILGGRLNMIISSDDSVILGGATNSINNSNYASIVGGCYNGVCNNSDYSSVVGGCRNCIINNSDYSSILGGGRNCIYGSDYASIVGSHKGCISNSDYSSLIGGYYNCISSSEYSSVIGGCSNVVSYYSSNSSTIGGRDNRVENSCNSSILGGYNNVMCCSHCSTVIGGYNNEICGYDGNCQYGSSILGGIYNNIYDGVDNSSIIGGYSNDICYCSDHSTIVGGCNNLISNDSTNSTILGGYCNVMCCSSNSVILGGHDLSICQRNNTVFLNGTTNFKQTIEVSVEDSVASSPKSIDFNTGAVKYLSSLSTDFQVDFTNIPTIANTTITYTLILNQGATPYMITGLTINGGSLETIKWANATSPEGNADQVDIVGLMFIFGTSGTLSQVLGQMGTFA